MGPVGAFIAGGALCAAAAYGIWNLFRDEHRSALTEGLAEFRKKTLESLDTRDGGPVWQGWVQSVAKISESVGAYLEGQFVQILAMLTAPAGAGRDSLEQKRAALAAALKGIGVIRGEVIQVAQRAEDLK